MKPTLFAAAVAITLVTTSTSSADVLKLYFIELGRNLGYGISDGYHANRDCLPAYSGCSSCSPSQHPVMQQPPVPQPMMHYPMMTPEYSQAALPQLQQVRYPAGYYVAPAYLPQFQQLPQSRAQTPVPSFTRPPRNPASLW
ncbi:MAG: hypothetical protein H6822_15450 [Planctomycetaceae bacterium]|nr:hypothetical protein [Planctomycetales bacterium]MCB9923576.1 hypothetical protein [Planctomycetaceae bacterium]